MTPLPNAQVPGFGAPTSLPHSLEHYTLHSLPFLAFQLTGFRNWEAIKCLEWMPFPHSLTHDGGCGLLLRCVAAAAAEHLLLPTQRRRRRPPAGRQCCGWNLWSVGAIKRPECSASTVQQPSQGSLHISCPHWRGWGVHGKEDIVREVA